MQPTRTNLCACQSNAATLCDGTTPSSSTNPLAPVVFAFWQPGYGPMPDMDFYNLQAPIPGHVVGSSLSRRTLEAKGYQIPQAESRKAYATRPAKEGCL